MLTKLLPDQISRFWDVISYAVQQSLPPTVGENPNKMNRILTSALSGKIAVWASYVKGEVNKFEGIVLTKILYDDSSDTKNLLIYCIYGYSDVGKESYLEGIFALSKYAKAQGCQQVVGYTNVGFVVDLVKALGGDVSYTFLSFDVNKIIKSFKQLENKDGQGI